MKYLVDSNCFIESKNVSNPLDVAVSFWNKIRDLAVSGKIYSIDKVREELLSVNDELSEWVKTNIPSSFFLSTASADVMTQYANTMAWSTGQGYQPAAIAEYAEHTRADAFLVAYAMTDPGNTKIVTNEVGGNGSVKRVKIPDACSPYCVKCVRIMQMLRELGETF